MRTSKTRWRRPTSWRRKVDLRVTESHSIRTLATKKKRTVMSPKPAAALGRPSELSGRIGDLAERIGGVGPLADAVGVSIRMIQRYHAEDVYPPLPVRRMLAILARQYGTEAPFPIT